MPNATHHQVFHAASQAVVASPPTWLNTLPDRAQSPIFLTFVPCFVMLVLLMIWHRHNLYRRGERLTTQKTTRAGYVGVFLLGGALFFLRDKFPIIPLIMEWPDRHLAYYRAHGFEMWVGFLAAGLVARMVSALYAALFLRGGGSSRGGNGVGFGMAAGRHTLLPNPPEGYGWFSSPTAKRTITRKRTIHSDWED